jgi:hypothetical protein
MLRFLTLAFIAALLVPAAAGAAVQPTANEDVVAWTTKKSKLKPSAKKVKISFAYGTCGIKRPNAISRIVVKRKAKAVVITVLMTKLPAGGPYTICPEIAQTFKRTVSLKGKLGKRKVKDGSTTPAAVRVKPKR